MKPGKAFGWIVGLLAATTMLAAGSAKAAPIIIDTFDVEQDVGLLGIPMFIPSSSQEGPDASILGGFRDMQVTGDADNFLETRLQSTGGGLTFSNNVETSGIGQIVWDGDDDPTTIDPTGLGGIDITRNGDWDLDRIWLDLVSADLPGLELTFNIYDTNNNVSTLSRTFNNPVNAPVGVNFLFSDFAGAADFTNVGALELLIDGPEEIDARIALVQIGQPHGDVDIPEPLTSVLTLVGISALGGLSLKRKLGRQ